jgi:hypothetical protein
MIENQYFIQDIVDFNIFFPALISNLGNGDRGHGNDKKAQGKIMIFL